MHNQLQKIINLIKKTGDRIIIFDNANADNSYVIMDYNEYEKLIIGKSEVRGLTKNELLDKINRNIAIWKSDKDFDNLNSFYDIKGDNDNININNDADYIEKDFLISFKNEIDKKVDNKSRKEKNNNWSIPKVIKQSAEEVIDEDKRYLEEIPY
ncbi:hypothetical protein CO115_01655 [Candidatus Falkowbacteria bacterium CG_4_9_14_3_um_filter_36_9]|uniref:Uncharacterized protein n=2 Tax=Candidatus Falkowiibacteriota TaxID=1752728 RepID=A0A1J4T9Z8_9BACT|nr:MAG: hypothetical protein AUJ27_00445 [Candidatus Falkowbacteria bacterium CG1_02_37_44]PIV51867.1 MAG: hypothetical protein COS18_01660 [Candidatus Falkowbacteria bacterium CG02_land_8_20_14_3_00_36_14]PIX12068.1 MAG: hypothetical protein COZ73_01055 [Candidatus Falkowbacteria bacterium CG_4_8_14_3_um_filter_36_11]PJA10840.1 MAG: hypothetical protein COX67_02835 [Candidatus Falkowbacteria bacterium CG_4_10_14_0_2_um_filter_36_22]PJB20224.1 MAG: hypothetical protein CO115_01655 [Candidatus F